MLKSVNLGLLFGGCAVGFLGTATLAINLAGSFVSQVENQTYKTSFFAFPPPPGALAELANTGEGAVFALGRTAYTEEISAWDVDVRPDGRGLPKGSGNAFDGEEIFADLCASCHGDFAEGVGNWPVLAGGFDTLADEDPVKTVGSYWPFLSTVWDYVHRSMPFGGAGELTADETYAIVAYILYSNDLIDEEFDLSRDTFLDMVMPNAGGFIVDDRAETEYLKWSGEPCMSNCKPGAVEITREATRLNVTPGQNTMPDQYTQTIAKAKARTDASNATTGEGAVFGLGRGAHDEEIIAWDVDIRPDGRGLPDGSGNAVDGEEVFADLCASCHGDFAEGVGNWPVLAGGFDTLADEDPVKTVGSYWPYLSTVWDYVHRSMPFGGAGDLTDDEVYQIVAYILYSNDIIDDEFELNRETWDQVVMPNAHGFIVDDRVKTEYPIWSGEACMENCKPQKGIITKRATELNVTPGQDRSQGSMGAEVAAASASAPAVAEGPGDLIKKGEKVFKKCGSCHAIGDKAKHKTGPLLTGIMGTPVGGADGFKYSAAFAEANASGMIWDDEAMRAFLANPKSAIKGTKMSFSGLKNDGDLDAIIAYLNSHSEQDKASLEGLAENGEAEVVEASLATLERSHSIDPALLAVEGDIDYGEYLSSECTTCHQLNGVTEGVPSVVNWAAEDFMTAMYEYKNKSRENPVMQMVAGRLNPEEIASLALYFGKVGQ